MLHFNFRVHLYQASDIPAADSNGLTDPFVNCYFMDTHQKSKVIQNSLYPAYYQTLVFDDVTIPEIDNFKYAPLVSFRLYDEVRSRFVKDS